MLCVFFFFKQKTAYEMRISDWSSDVCSSDLQQRHDAGDAKFDRFLQGVIHAIALRHTLRECQVERRLAIDVEPGSKCGGGFALADVEQLRGIFAAAAVENEKALAGAQAQHLHQMPECGIGQAQCGARSEEHTSELQSLMRISHAVFCLKKKT